ncbi:hypothetical protein NA655_04435 [Pseudomonas kuykendallii]|uniref:Uncharacterized protein n=1 Tax=Pseudomonas kuykendallii TaxID=1007099 RepID=A0A1H3DIN1_9PSED|nr:hypothetical protein [Pseudomonas kuykendallii]MCQ4270265.1 hypothetical protein [Pseudomonas kuykendallii]SDX66276.1 hypothetical protein SAMN05216287_3444 [Pseudomonas kuykendallii]
MIDIEQVRTLSPVDGAVYVLPEHSSPELLAAFAEALHVASAGVRCLVTCCDVQQLDERAMNAAGWYRR